MLIDEDVILTKIKAADVRGLTHPELQTLLIPELHSSVVDCVQDLTAAGKAEQRVDQFGTLRIYPTWKDKS
jgi:hypothetical protein